MFTHNIIILLQRRHLIYNPGKKCEIEMHIVFHLGVLYRDFMNDTFDEILIEKH